MGDMDAFITFIIELVGASKIIEILNHAQNSTRFFCPNCKTYIVKGTCPCPCCHTPLRWF